MATRTPKAATKTPKSREAKEAAADKKPGNAKPVKATKPSKPSKPGKPARKEAKAQGKGKKPAAPRMVFEEVAPEPAKPSFFERLRQKREQRAQDRQALAAQKAAERARAAEESRKAEEARQKAAEKAEAERQKAAEEAEREMRKEVAAAERRRAAAEARQRKADLARAKEEARERANEVRRQERAAERAALAERERIAAEEAEAEDRRKAEEREAARREKEAAAAEAAAREPAELEPEMEFEEASQAVDPARALVPAKKAAAEKPSAGKKAEPPTVLDEQAEKMAAELSRRRSKPVVIVGEDLPTLKIQKPGAPKAEDSEELVFEEAVVDDKYKTAPPPPAPTGLSIPEMFILVANEGGWDERVEKTRSGSLGGALAGALMLELLQRGRVLVQRDRFTIVGEPTGDEALAAVVAKLRRIQERKRDASSLRQMELLAKWDRELLEPFKDRLAERGLAEHGHRMHLGLFYRSHVDILDEDAQERLRNKLRRAIAGGGTPEASSILLLGLLDACGLLGAIVPDEAMDYNRKRLNGLLSGRDIMGYKVDAQLKATQEVAVRTILQNVRLLTT